MGAWRENEFQDTLTEWESIIEERESSSHEQVPDSIKSVVLAERALNALYEHASPQRSSTLARKSCNAQSTKL